FSNLKFFLISIFGIDDAVVYFGLTLFPAHRSGGHVFIPKRKRQSFLLGKYHFTCQCIACVHDFPLLCDMIVANIPEIHSNGVHVRLDKLLAENIFQKCRIYLRDFYESYPCKEIYSIQMCLSKLLSYLLMNDVAERVLMFEKCPEAKALRNIPKEPAKIATKPVAKPAESHTTLQRHIRGSKNVYIPKFYYPFGKPASSISLEQQTLQRLQAAFDQFPNKQVPKENFINILKICALPLYWRMPLFHCAATAPNGLCDGKKFIDFWKQMSVFCHDQTSRFVFILSHGQRSRQYILPEDLVSLVQDVVDTHPGLAFLKEAAEFHSRYVHTVIARIFYTVNRSWSGRITIPELRRSNLLQVIQLLEEEEDINQIMAYFSYEHFYVIYCKFWELDRDHDLFIDQHDLTGHNDHALSARIIDRIFSGCVTKGVRDRNGVPKMSYTEFVWFLLSEEDKTNPTAVEYWFRCMDLDGDGVLSMYELEYFYEEQQQRMEAIGIETLPFEDCLCQMLDMIKPMRPGFVTLSDLKRCKMTPIFYDTFFNLEKYMEHEQRDPFATQRDQDDMTDWDRYAAQEYELLVAEEGGDTQGSYDEDEDEYESNIDILESQLDDCMSNMINEW
ncbi:Serine/threonine-protein phosphatase 2A regulatory subunit B'' subunit alpha, partial [Pseudolycoriella hygida]